MRHLLGAFISRFSEAGLWGVSSCRSAPGSFRARVINAPCGGEELEMAVSVPVRILRVPRSPHPTASGLEKTSCFKKKKQTAEPSHKLGLCGAYLGLARRRIDGELRCDEAQLSAARTRRYARGLTRLRLVNAEGDTLGLCLCGVFFPPLFLKQILQLIKMFSPYKLPPSDSSSFF